MPPSNTPAGSPQTPPTLPVASWAPVAPEEPVTQPLSGESCSLGSVHVEGRGRRALGPVRCQTLSLSPFLTSPLPHPPSLSSSFLRCLLPSPVGSCMGCSMVNRSTPGLPVHHQLPEFTQTHLPGVLGAGKVSTTSTKALPGARRCFVGWLCGEAVLPASLASSVDRVRVRGGAGVDAEPWPAWTARVEPGFHPS